MSDNNDYKSPWGKSGDGFGKKRIDDFISKSPKDFGKMLDPKLFNSNFIIGALSIILVIWLLSGFYMVREGEQAAITRFGAFNRIATAGANYHIPAPIESVEKVRVDHIQREEIGFRSSGSGAINFSKSNVKPFPEESLMLTGDENIADVNFFVQWRVSNIEDYLYQVKSVKTVVKSLAESAMREVIGNSTIAEAQTEGRAKVEAEAKHLVQQTLDEYKAGVIIENLNLLKVDPPAEVIDSFRDVQTARADKERKVNQAESYRNDILPKARGEAAKIVQESEGYKNQVVAKAKGEAEKFKEIYAQYEKAKDITKKRMYLDTMETVLSGMNKVIISDGLNKSMTPYLPLKQLDKK